MGWTIPTFHTGSPPRSTISSAREPDGGGAVRGIPTTRSGIRATSAPLPQCSVAPRMAFRKCDTDGFAGNQQTAGGIGSEYPPSKTAGSCSSHPGPVLNHYLRRRGYVVLYPGWRGIAVGNRVVTGTYDLMTVVPTLIADRET